MTVPYFLDSEYKYALCDQIRLSLLRPNGCIDLKIERILTETQIRI
jgi:hypothetical protein